jgi:hypothetical protein
VSVFLAAILWLVSWVNAPEGLESSLKVSFPQFEEVEGLRAKFLFSLEGVTEDSKGYNDGLRFFEESPGKWLYVSGDGARAFPAGMLTGWKTSTSGGSGGNVGYGSPVP